MSSQFLVTLLLGIPTASVAQTKHTPTVLEEMNVKYAAAPQISPDGRFIAYSVQETDWEHDRYVNQIWLIDTRTDTNIQLTRGSQSSDSPSWSPDSRWLAFATDQTATTPIVSGPSSKETAPQGRQIWLISPFGGEAWELTDSRTGIGQFHWSPDAKTIAFTAAAPESNAEKNRTKTYGSFTVVGKDFQQNQLWEVNVAAGSAPTQRVEPKRLLDDLSLSVADFSWSPDSTRIVFTGAANPLLSAFGSDDIYLLDLSKENVVKRIVHLPAPDFSPLFSPDGNEIAFLSWMGQRNYFYENLHIATVELEDVLARPAGSPSAVKDLTADFDENPALLAWGAKGIFFSAYQQSHIDLLLIDPATRKIRPVVAPANAVLEGASFTSKYDKVAFVSEDASHMAEVYTSAVDAYRPRQWTDMTAQVKQWTLGIPEVITWKSEDGLPIEGVLYKPADYNPRRKYPLFVELHGGPADLALPTLSPAEAEYPIQQLLAKGALVLKPNYRNSAGFGERFRALNLDDIGAAEMKDVMSGVDHLIQEGIIDPNRMALLGSSWGGYLASFIVTHTDRFKAASESSGLLDLMTIYANTDNPEFIKEFFHATPWQNPAVYWKNSPVSVVGQTKTPMLLQAGANDPRVPPASAYEFYRALQDSGVEARLIVYPGFGHSANNPKPMYAVIQSNLDWLANKIWQEPISSSSPLWGTGEALPPHSCCSTQPR